MLLNPARLLSLQPTVRQQHKLILPFSRQLSITIKHQLMLLMNQKVRLTSLNLLQLQQVLQLIMTIKLIRPIRLKLIWLNQKFNQKVLVLHQLNLALTLILPQLPTPISLKVSKVQRHGSFLQMVACIQEIVLKQQLQQIIPLLQLTKLVVHHPLKQPLLLQQLQPRQQPLQAIQVQLIQTVILAPLQPLQILHLTLIHLILLKNNLAPIQIQHKIVVLIIPIRLLLLPIQHQPHQSQLHHGKSMPIISTTSPLMVK